MSYEAIMSAMLQSAKRDIARSRLDDLSRRVGETKIEIDFFDRKESEKPHEDYNFDVHGRHYEGSGARWAVWRYRWNGSEWKRARRLSGPLKFGDALTRATETRAAISKARGTVG